MSRSRLTPCTVAHVGVLAAMHALCFAKPWVEEDFVRLLATPGSAALIAVSSRDDGEPAGFILWRCAADEAEIITLGVVPAERRGKLGAALVEAAMARSRTRAKAVFLEVAVDNWAARRLYGSLGFLEIDRRQKYYKVGASSTDAIVYRKTII